MKEKVLVTNTLKAQIHLLNIQITSKMYVKDSNI